MMTLQYILISAVLLAAIGYAAWRIYQVVTHAGDKCYGCSGCALKEQLKGRGCAGNSARQGRKRK